MKTLGNILWHFPFFGFVNAALVYVFGFILTLTIVAAPIGLGLMEFGKFLFWPFGNAMIRKKDLNIDQNVAWKTYSTIVKILYLPFGVILCILAIGQIVFLFCTIFGIPVAIVIAKSLRTYLSPVNKKCVSNAVKEELERRKAQVLIDTYQKNTSVAHNSVIPPPIVITNNINSNVPSSEHNEFEVNQSELKTNFVDNIEIDTNDYTQAQSISNTQRQFQAQSFIPSSIKEDNIVIKEQQTNDLKEPITKSINSVADTISSNIKGILIICGSVFGLVLFIVGIKFLLSLNFNENPSASLTNMKDIKVETKADNENSSINEEALIGTNTNTAFNSIEKSSSSLPETFEKQFKIKVNAKIRKKPTTSAKAIKTASKGKIVLTTEKSDRIETIEIGGISKPYNWYKINYNSSNGKTYTGWIYGGCLEENLD